MEDKLLKIQEHIYTQYGKQVNFCEQINTGVMNENYYCKTATGEEYILKVYSVKTKEEIAFEKNVLVHLEQKNFPSPRLVYTSSGNWTVPFAEKPGVLYTFIPGVPVSEVNENILTQVGKMLGRLHVDVADCNPGVFKPGWSPEKIQQLVQERGQELVERNFPEAQSLLDFVTQELKKYSFPPLPQGITHQDVKSENILILDGVVQGLIDFDNSYECALIHDLTTTIIWMCTEEEKISSSLVEAFLQGYESIRPLTQTEKEVFHDAIAWRLIREIFIGPFVTLNYPEVVKERSDTFKKIYNNFIRS